jgi:hypothetical protein
MRSRAARSVASVAAAFLVAVDMGAPSPALATGPQVSAAASGATSGAIEVTWTPVAGAVGYSVAPQRLTSGGEWAAVPGREERFTTVRPAVFDGLINGASYRACVAAVLPTGFVVAVSEPAIPYGLPGAPTIGELQRAGDELTVTWAPAAANGRQISAYSISATPNDAAGGTASTVEIVVGGNETTVVLEGLDEDADYVITIRATNLRGQGEIATSAAPSVMPTAFTPDSSTGSLDGTVDRNGATSVSDAGPCTGAVIGSTNPPQGGDARTGGRSVDGSRTDTAPVDRSGASRPSVRSTDRTDDAEAAGEGTDPGVTSPDPQTPSGTDETGGADQQAVDAVAPDEPTSSSSSTVLGVILLMLASSVVGGALLKRRRGDPSGSSPAVRSSRSWSRHPRHARSSDEAGPSA